MAHVRRLSVSNVDPKDPAEKNSKVSIGDSNDVPQSKIKNDDTYKIEFEGVGMVLKSGVKIMSGVTGAFLPKRTCAIMGPSGAGKVKSH